MPIKYLKNAQRVYINLGKSAADVKMEIPVLALSLKSSMLSSTIFLMDKTFWEVVSATVE